MSGLFHRVEAGQVEVIGARNDVGLGNSAHVFFEHGVHEIAAFTGLEQGEFHSARLDPLPVDFFLIVTDVDSK